MNAAILLAALSGDNVLGFWELLPRSLQGVCMTLWLFAFVAAVLALTLVEKEKILDWKTSAIVWAGEVSLLFILWLGNWEVIPVALAVPLSAVLGLATGIFLLWIGHALFAYPRWAILGILLAVPVLFGLACVIPFLLTGELCWR